MKRKSLFSAVLAFVMLSVSAGAAAAPDPATEAQLPQAEPAAGQYLADTGVITDLLYLCGLPLAPEGGGDPASGHAERSIELDRTGERTGKVVYHLSGKTAIINAVTGEEMSFSQLETGEEVCVIAGEALMLSEPPQGHALVVLAGLPEDGAYPACRQVTAVRRGDAGVSAQVGEDLIYHLDPEKTKVVGKYGLDSLKPGDLVAAWYDDVAESYPAQAWPRQLVIVPQHAGWLEADETEIRINGAPLDLPEGVTPRYEDGELLLPLRSVGEALGCTVTWEAARPDQVTVSGPEGLSYTLELDGSLVKAVNRIVYVRAACIIGQHDLFLAQA
ncbi:hypothetical protein D1159_15980 [Pseudoflavonifractor sp. 524-17]|uniref:stalk domain-containing protein n=1 Tax=Pseudoflavonifractor sp. 524-17 TaxID=2304577 RepID=UPI001379FD89|nr:stalk domain-containing protein [Pseudoflavonifractor sp. 524-17]NCE66035.1 hypothetical protein [Pseudoflavonifractor sp. 524-17]